jgi:outer membrane protein assembly factor BamA
MDTRLVVVLIGLICCTPPALGQTDSSSSSASLHGFPYVYYTPETDWAFGGAAVVTFRINSAPELSPSSVVLDAYYTVKKQYNITLAPELYLDRNRLLVSCSMEYGRIVDKFWGIGSRTSNSDSTEYVKRITRFQARALMVLTGGLKAGLLYEYDRTSMLDTGLNPLLRAGTVDGSGGALSSGAGVTLTWDTRDNIFYPSGGSLHQFDYTAFAPAFGGDHAFQRSTLDLRAYYPLGGGHIIGVQGGGMAISGAAPFYMLAPLGGGMIMRGYFTGRYRDRILLAAQVEYRNMFFPRFGGVVFAGAGDVAPSFSAFHLKDIKPTYGAGLRFMMDPKEKLTLRVDFGVGRGSNGIYLAMKEAF